jgi:hypothetical protein
VVVRNKERSDAFVIQRSRVAVLLHFAFHRQWASLPFQRSWKGQFLNTQR